MKNPYMRGNPTVLAKLPTRKSIRVGWRIQPGTGGVLRRKARQENRSNTRVAYLGRPIDARPIPG